MKSTAHSVICFLEKFYILLPVGEKKKKQIGKILHPITSESKTYMFPLLLSIKINVLSQLATLLHGNQEPAFLDSRRETGTGKEDTTQDWRKYKLLLCFNSPG